MESRTMAEAASLTTWLPGALSGANTLRGVELDSRTLLLHQFQSICIMLLWMLGFFAKILLSILPSLGPVPFLANALHKLSNAGDEYSFKKPERTMNVGQRSIPNSPVGRALTQVLALVNDVPASSSKYGFLHDLADRVIEENKAEGGKYNSINQAALTTGFARTIHLLEKSLEIGRRRDTLLGRLMTHLPTGAMLPSMAISGPLGKVRLLLGQIFSPINPWISRPAVTAAAQNKNLADTDMAEKFAKELLWIGEKLVGCGGIEDAIQQWSSVPYLAELSLSASPRVQKSLVRLCALLCKGLVWETNVPHEMCMKSVLLWLPLLCHATHGGDGPIFNSLEKGDAERLLERTVLSLSQSDQELILSTWLQEYAMSQSDWPNLQKCYNTWCCTTRKLELASNKFMNE